MIFVGLTNKEFFLLEGFIQMELEKKLPGDKRKVLEVLNSRLNDSWINSQLVEKKDHR